MTARRQLPDADVRLERMIVSRRFAQSHAHGARSANSWPDWTTPLKRDRASARHSLTTVSSAPRRERLAQAARGAEFERHAQEVRRRRVEVGEGVSRHRNQRNRRRALVEYPDRSEAAHVRHEDIDEHQVEAGVFQRTKPGLAAIGYRHLKAVPIEIDLDGRADHGIVIDDEHA